MRDQPRSIWTNVLGNRSCFPLSTGQRWLSSWVLVPVRSLLIILLFLTPAFLLVSCGDDNSTDPNPDGLKWTDRSLSGVGSISDVTWTGNQFVATANVILTSPDGITWTEKDLGSSLDLRAVAASDTLIVVVGNTQVGQEYHGVVLTSKDGNNWSQHTIDRGDLSDWYEKLREITWTGPEFVVVGPPDSILTSADGTNWDEHSLGLTVGPLFDVTWSGTRFVAVGDAVGDPVADSGCIITSTDGTSWTPMSLGTLERLRGIVWTGSHYYVVGRGGTVLTSYDDIQIWTSVDTKIESDWYNEIIWTGDLFVIAADDGLIVTSPDGVNWRGYQTNVDHEFEGIAWSGTRLVAVGDDGAIVTADHK